MTMQDKPNDVLLLAGKVLAVIMQIFMAIGALALTIAIPVILFMQGKITEHVRAEYGDAIGAFPAMPVLGLLVIGLAIVGMVFVFFGKLRAIIETVGDGDPFVPENADRLSLMAWLQLAIQLLLIPAAGLGLLVATWAEKIDDANINMDGGFDLTGILLVILLFILARVFKHGARMREDLEGTV